MPYPSQVSREKIITQAWQMIDAQGGENVSLSRLAAALGIRAPSLYRHVGNKAALIRAVNLHTSQQLVLALNLAASDTGGSPMDRLIAIMLAYRIFAHDHPNSYVLAFTNKDDTLQPNEDALEKLALPLQTLIAAVSGEAASLAALRGAMALAHGFVMLELHGQLRRGGDLDVAFDMAVTAYLRGWQTADEF